ncbi:carboxypeptidase-like regulatory domain-containing protein [Hymenobacter psoromatis]|uniref:carboxypeptidase-like regulatory domain-containing protein n=1 Tax=Hymenobacter psoromatis TaxID=1484116 RepID=UPI001CBAF039|nr:carboxypeptidase-like regulatory domain-containing protein [Hymenobacter psoromatis]
MFPSYFFRAVVVALLLAVAGPGRVFAFSDPTTTYPPIKKATSVASREAVPQTPVGTAAVATVPTAAIVRTLATPDTSAAAPQLIQLRGVVLNPDGRPCAGASVFPAGAPRQLVVTDAQGSFVLPVPAGTALALQVEYFGVGSSRVAVSTPSAEPLRITLGN